MAATAKKSTLKVRPVLVSCLAAKLIGHLRVTTQTSTFTLEHFSMAFPAFRETELEYALTELTDKALFKQSGHTDRASYALTERGREVRVGVN
ncbi:MAG TPA: hypothetical protein VHM90_01195 [Phycisphaerae bacterium]|nr:hypothetical protein [Phycisphaerae bacterium]